MTSAPGEPDDDMEKNWLPSFLRRPPSDKPVIRSNTVFKAPQKVFAPEAATGEAEAPKRKPAPAKPTAKASAKPDKAKVKAKAAPVKAKGKKVKAERNVDQSKLDSFGFRLSSIKSKAAALYARKGGATLGEVKEELDSTQFNVLTELKEKGHTVDTKQEDGEGNRKITRYFVKAKK